eukprot:4730867-Amphidinium_carterae.1
MSWGLNLHLILYGLRCSMAHRWTLEVTGGGHDVHGSSLTLRRPVLPMSVDAGCHSSQFLQPQEVAKNQECGIGVQFLAYIQLAD